MAKSFIVQKQKSDQNIPDVYLFREKFICFVDIPLSVGGTQFTFPLLTSTLHSENEDITRSEMVYPSVH